MADETREGGAHDGGTATPAPGPVAREPRRRSRWLIVPSGWLLVACLFLPSLEVCSGGGPFRRVEIAPIAFPPLWLPYLVGLVVAASAAARGPDLRTLGRLQVGLVWLASAVTCVFAGGVLLDDGPALGPVLVIGAAVIASVAVPRPRTELAIACTSAMCAAGVEAFAIAFATGRHALWGTQVTLGAASALLVGALWWCAEAAWRSPRPRHPRRSR